MTTDIFLDEALQDDDPVTLEELTMLVVRMTQDFIRHCKEGRLTDYEKEIVSERIRTGRLVEGTTANLSTVLAQELTEDQISTIYFRQWVELSAYAEQYWERGSSDLGLPRVNPVEDEVYYVRRLIAKSESDLDSYLVLSSGEGEYRQVRLETIRGLIDSYITTAAGKVATPMYAVFSTFRG